MTFLAKAEIEPAITRIFSFTAARLVSLDLEQETDVLNSLSDRHPPLGAIPVSDCAAPPAPSVCSVCLMFAPVSASQSRHSVPPLVSSQTRLAYRSSP